MAREPASGKDISLGGQVAAALGRELLSGRFAPGDVLPTEMALIERFGVSRASVRSGLQTLAACGIVRRFVGQGTIVQDFADWNILDPVVTGWMADQQARPPELVRAIFEFRYSAEPLVAALAARNSDARDLLAMEEAYEGMANFTDSPGPRGPEFTEHDVNFHVAIYKATHNVVWARLAHILRPAIALVVAESNDTNDELRYTLDRHRALFEAIRLRDPAAAYDAAARVMRLTGRVLDLSAAEGLEEGAVGADPLRGLFPS